MLHYKGDVDDEEDDDDIDKSLINVAAMILRWLVSDNQLNKRN